MLYLSYQNLKTSKLCYMENKKNILYALILSTAGCFVLPGCQQRGAKGFLSPQVYTASIDTVIRLQEESETPSCKINLDFSYLQSDWKNDSTPVQTNATIQRYIFGEAYAGLPPEDVLPTLAEEYARNYQSDVKGLFEADLHHGMAPDDIPAWYNYEFQLSTEMKKGRKGVWNYTATFFQYTGGAHPNTQVTCLNLDPQSGQILDKDDVFNIQDSASICKLIMSELIKETNRRMGTDTITSLDGLQETGILLDTYLYIPANFLLEEDGVTFYYNHYEIAPYSAGSFRLKVGYDDIQTYMKQ